MMIANLVRHSRRSSCSSSLALWCGESKLSGTLVLLPLRRPEGWQASVPPRFKKSVRRWRTCRRLERPRQMRGWGTGFRKVLSEAVDGIRNTKCFELVTTVNALMSDRFPVAYTTTIMHMRNRSSTLIISDTHTCICTGIKARRVSTSVLQ